MITAMIHLLFIVAPSGPPRETCGELFRETARYAQEMPDDPCEKWGWVALRTVSHAAGEAARVRRGGTPPMRHSCTAGQLLRRAARTTRPLLWAAAQSLGSWAQPTSQD